MLRRCATLALGVGLTLTACTTEPPDGPAARATGYVGFEHVHGLGVDPADGMLYAATHFGLFRVPEHGDAERVADRHQDTMGFTVAGERTFLGSGHPDFHMDPDLPTQLGLIRSEDAGESWEIVSLGGEADFHALRAAHGNVYAWDAGTGRVMVSADGGQTWETRSTLDLRDLIVHPDDPAVLLATTERGLLRSEDGGRTWAAPPEAPMIGLLGWAATPSLYGIAPDGIMHRSADGGLTWTEQGSLTGKPEALHVDHRDGVENIYVAVSPARILVSTDGGTSFTSRYAD
ncbi:F510_1955 family glycosylhydrolase [Blastococcus sp. PRF04-17]|uniref:F510_1955 family glycosylhydrolase n=1 Tax=Blastococcus sp. PRF04-17 TaxID=2933797 RepID=UPI001FF632DE|nr:hypothetical protein [Blastococcus sp. PRF04-17]UOY00138.1 hypothetical protein MVA48_14090 [Blastococcus sp. PRF04-17]